MLPEPVEVIVFVFEPTDRDNVGDAVALLDATDADRLGDVDEVFEDDTERVYIVCELVAVRVYMPVGLGAGVNVTL